MVDPETVDEEKLEVLHREAIAHIFLIAWSLLLLLVVVNLMVSDGVMLYEHNGWILKVELVIVLEVIALGIWNITH